MSAEAGVDEAVLEALDFDVACTVRLEETIGRAIRHTEKRCDHPAVWVCRCRVCGRCGVVCEEHRVRVVATLIVTCQCGSVAPGVALFEFSPLGSKQ